MANFAKPVSNRPTAFGMREISSATTRRVVNPSNALSLQGRDMYRLPPWRTRPGCAGVDPPEAFHPCSSLSTSSIASVRHMVAIRSNVFCAKRPSGATDENSRLVEVSRIAAIIIDAANSVFPLPRATTSSSALVAGVSVFTLPMTRRLASKTIATMHCHGIHSSGLPASSSTPWPHRRANDRASSARTSSHHTSCAAGARRSSK